MEVVKNVTVQAYYPWTEIQEQDLMHLQPWVSQNPGELILIP